MPNSRSKSRRCSGRSRSGLAAGLGRPSLRYGVVWNSRAPNSLSSRFAGGCLMIRLLVATILSTWLVFPALCAGLDAATINGAEYRAKLPADDKVDAVVVKLQVLLDRVRLSPGEIDGKLGENAQKALKAFAEAKGLASDKVLTPEI